MAGVNVLESDAGAGNWSVDQAELKSRCKASCGREC
jgi:hypothetical protein